MASASKPYKILFRIQIKWCLLYSKAIPELLILLPLGYVPKKHSEGQMMKFTHNCLISIDTMTFNRNFILCNRWWSSDR